MNRTIASNVFGWDYPAGAENDPKAPWNEPSDPDAVTKEMEFICELRRRADVSTINYTPGAAEIIYEHGECDVVYAPDDFSETDWVEEWHNNHFSPEELLSILSEIATNLAQNKTPKYTQKQLLRIAEECKGWDVEDEDYDIID
jgi:hypothetical protein